MKLSSLFAEDHVLVQFGGESLEEVIRALLERVCSELGENEAGAIVNRIMAHESRHASIVGEGVCLAHCRLEGISRARAALAVPEKMIAHPAGGQELKMVFLILAPQNQNTAMLQTLAAIARLLSSKAFVSTVTGVRSPSRLIRLIEESGVEVKGSLCAADIMEPLEPSLRLDTSLADAVDALVASRDEGLQVVDDKGKLTGEITTREVLILGMPKYMDLLSNPEMLNAFEPFENYFLKEHKLHVRDICRRDFVAVTPSTPIVSVAHQMITENRRRVYVLDDEKIVGVIYRKSFLTRVMNP